MYNRRGGGRGGGGRGGGEIITLCTCIIIQGGKEEMSYYKTKSVRGIKGGREGVNPDCVIYTSKN